MAAMRVFISFDFDHDEDLRCLQGRRRTPTLPSKIANWSVKETFTGEWKGKVRDRIKRVEQLAVICGHHTDEAMSVSAEVAIA